MPPTTSKPLSLQTNPDVISNWTVARMGVPSSLPWVQVCEEGAEPYIQGSINQAPMAHMTFATPWSNYLSYNAGIFTSILGGYDPTTMKMAAPMEWPFEGRNAGLFATDVHVRMQFLDNSVAWTPGATGGGAPYRLALYTITFQALPYAVNSPQGELTFNPNWLEFKNQATNEAFQTPVGEFVFSAATSVTALSGTFLTFESSYVEVVAHRLPETTVIDDAGIGRCAVQDLIGTINENDIFGCDAKTLLFDSLVIAPFGDWNGFNIYDVHLFFNYRPQGWNTALSPAGTWLQIQTISGGAPPFGTTDFAPDIFNVLIPPNE